MKKVQSSLYKAAHAYKPQQLCVDATLFEASVPVEPEGDRYGEWDTLLDGKIERHQIKSDHLAIMKPPIIDDVAQMIASIWPPQIEVKLDEALVRELCGFWAVNTAQPLVFEPVTAQDLPKGVDDLLDHEDSMTRVLADSWGQDIRLTVLAKQHYGSHFIRKVSLSPENAAAASAMAIIRINLKGLSETVRKDVIEGRLPFGTVMTQHGVAWRRAPASFFSIQVDDEMKRDFKDDTLPSLLFGRHNVLTHGDGSPMADVIEIVRPVTGVHDDHLVA